MGLAGSVSQNDPFALDGIGVAIAAQLNLWNIGAEGQLYLGAIATTWLALGAARYLMLISCCQYSLLGPSLLGVCGPPFQLDCAPGLG